MPANKIPSPTWRQKATKSLVKQHFQNAYCVQSTEFRSSRQVNRLTNC